MAWPTKDERLMRPMERPAKQPAPAPVVPSNTKRKALAKALRK